MRKQRLVAAEIILEPAMAQLGISAVTGEVTLHHRIGDQRKLTADNERLVEWYVVH